MVRMDSSSKGNTDSVTQRHLDNLTGPLFIGQPRSPRAQIPLVPDNAPGTSAESASHILSLDSLCCQLTATTDKGQIPVSKTQSGLG